MNVWSSGKGFDMNCQIIWFKSHSGQLGIFLLEMKLKNWLKSIIYTTCSRLNVCSSGKVFGMYNHIVWFKSLRRQLQLFCFKRS